jgi:proteic killer suppression protein
MPVDISFRTERLQRVCSRLDLLIATWGEVEGRTMARRLAVLRAAPTLADVRSAPGHCRELPRRGDSCLYVDLGTAYRIVLVPRTPVPANLDGSLDWERVKRIMIVDVIDAAD